MSDLPDFLISYPQFLESLDYGESDKERINFVISISGKMLQHAAIYVNLGVELTEAQQRELNMPDRPVIICPMDETALTFFTNQSEIQRLINETDPIRERLVFTTGRGKTVVDSVPVIDLMYIIAMPQDHVPVIVERNTKIINKIKSPSKGFG